MYEIVGLYPKYGRKGGFLVFSAHVYFLPPLDLDVRGYKINFTTKKDSKIYDPTEISYDFESQEVGRYPVIKFLGDGHKEMLTSLYQDLIEEAELEYKTFSFTKSFPKNYKEYNNFLKTKKEPEKKVRSPSSHVISKKTKKTPLKQKSPRTTLKGGSSNISSCR